MIRRLPIPFLLLLLVAARVAAVEFGPHPVVVFLGDSITEQNQYVALVEHLIATRLHARKPTVWNAGLGGDTAGGGNARFARDVAPLAPTLVLVAFGMNDGGYAAPDPAVRQRFAEAQRALAKTIAACGASEVLLTPPPVDGALFRDHGAYNDALGGIADETAAVATAIGAPVIDVFHPLLAQIDAARRRDQRLVFSYDGVHPTPPTNLALAYQIARGLELPGVVADLVVDGDGVRSTGGGAVTNATGRAGETVEFDLALPFLPAFVPVEMRPMLEHVPFEHDCNRFALTVAGSADVAWDLVVDGRALGTFSAAKLADGLDLAALDAAPWTRRAKLVYELGQLRAQHRYEATRRAIGREVDPPLANAIDRMVRVATHDVDELGAIMADAAVPPPAYHVALRPSRRVALASVELSPVYPLARAAFADALPPETQPSAIAWRRAPLADGVIDLLAATAAKDESAVFARVRLQAERACTVRLTLGSDDGLLVIANGKRVLARDVHRALKRDDERLECALQAGANELLLRVNQGDGGFGLAVAVERLDEARVSVVE